MPISTELLKSNHISTPATPAHSDATVFIASLAMIPFAVLIGIAILKWGGARMGRRWWIECTVLVGLMFLIGVAVFVGEWPGRLASVVALIAVAVIVDVASIFKRTHPPRERMLPNPWDVDRQSGDSGPLADPPSFRL
jgi:peptidoglycan/LPS O-acetylase OafA/YrhL